MAGLREAVKDYQDELQAGIAWVAFWREGRSWHSDYIYLETDDTLTPEDRGRLREIQEKDPAAVVLNGYYCGYLGEDMNLAELTAGVRRHYENGYNNVADFIEAHDDTLTQELLEEARAAAHAPTPKKTIMKPGRKSSAAKNTKPSKNQSVGADMISPSSNMTNSLHQRGCGKAFKQRQADDFTAMLFHNVTPDDALHRPVSTFHQDIR